MPWFGRKLRGVQNPETDVTKQLKLLTSANISEKQRKQPETTTGIETVHPRGFKTCEVNISVKLKVFSHDVHILFTVASHLFRIGFTYVGKAVQYHGLVSTTPMIICVRFLYLYGILNPRRARPKERHLMHKKDANTYVYIYIYIYIYICNIYIYITIKINIKPITTKKEDKIH